MAESKCCEDADEDDGFDFASGAEVLGDGFVVFLDVGESFLEDCCLLLDFLGFVLDEEEEEGDFLGSEIMVGRPAACVVDVFLVGLFSAFLDPEKMDAMYAEALGDVLRD